MKFYCLLLLLYLLTEKKFNNNLSLVEGQGWRSYTCNKNDPANRFFVVTNHNNVIDKKEDHYFYLDERAAATHKDFTLPNFQETLNLNIGKVTKILIPLDKLYFNHKSEYESVVNNINFLICPKNYAQNFGFFSELNEKNMLTNYGEFTKCSIYKCETGLYPKSLPGKKVPQILDIGKIDEAYFIGFEAIKSKHLDYIYFYGKNRVAGHSNIVLVACPYINWVTKNSLAKFIPSEYVKKNFPTVLNDNDRHRLVPAINIAKVARPPGDPNRHTFTCGTLEQDKILASTPSIKVGYEFDTSETIPAGTFAIKGEKFFCGDIDISNHYLFTLVNGSDRVSNQQPLLEYIDSAKTAKFYYNQLIYAYDKNHILKRHGGKHEEFFDVPDDPPIFNAVCMAKHAKEHAKLRLKINGILQYPTYKSTTNSTGKFESYIFDIEKQNGQELSCHPVLLRNSDDRYMDFYAEKYSTRIKKIKDSNGKPYNGQESTSIKITSNIEEMIGVYKCSIYNAKIPQIINSEFHLLAGKLEDQKKIIESFKTDKDMFKCEIVNINKELLVEMKVTPPKKETISYYFDKDNDKHGKSFSIKYDYIAYYPDDANGYKSNTIVKCIYKNEKTSEKSVVEKDIKINDLANNEEGMSKKILIPIICGIVGVVLILFAIIIFVVFKKRREKKKVGLLSAASSASGASSLSKSGLSEVRSTSKTSKVTKSRSKSKSVSRSKRSTLKSKTNKSIGFVSKKTGRTQSSSAR